MGKVAKPLAATIVVNTTDQEVNDDSDCSLQEAIYAANFDDNIAINPAFLNGPPITTGCTAGSGDDTIQLPPGLYQLSTVIQDQFSVPGLTANPRIFTNITIAGNGAKLELVGDQNLRAFTVSSGVITLNDVEYSGTGNLTLRDLHIVGFKAKGGNGTDGGGGGLGAGGAVYVNAGAGSLGEVIGTPSLTVERCTFEGNTATGGNGGAIVNTVGGGGGGGLGGNGAGQGTGGDFRGGGGGGGSRGSGGVAAASGGGGGGTANDGVIGGVALGGNGGFNCGGAGGSFQPDMDHPSINGSNGFCAGGSGGGGATQTTAASPTAGNGGNGNYGGGGGGGAGAGGNGTINGGNGGLGGFGGGGGSGGTLAGAGVAGVGGNGGFGGGGGTAGSSGSAHGLGGALAGAGGAAGGGGGAGLGGAIFNDSGEVIIRNSTFFNNSSVAGTSSGTGQGSAAGGAVFTRNGTLRIFNSTFSNHTSGTGADVQAFADGATVTFELRNNIIANGSGLNCGVNSGAVSQTNSGNLIEMNAGGASACLNVVSTADPQLGALTLNPPGLTPTMAITTTSPAFNTADGATALAEDQRGVTRPQLVGFDIGAYEANCVSIDCPDDIIRSNDPDQCAAVVNYSDPNVVGACGTVTCSPPAGSPFPVGTTTVTCASNVAAVSCMFTVTVNDTQLPTIECPANITQANDPDQCGAIVTYPSPAVDDNCPIVSVFTCDPPSGTFFDVGTTTVTCTVTDGAGNTASCPFTITVNDTQAPEIECPADVTAVTAPTCPPATMTTVTFLPPTVSDNCPLPPNAVACNPPSGSMFPVGVTTVNCTVIDDSGNTDSCSFTITVFNACIQDDTNPANVILFNTFTGDYRACCGGMVFTGKGTVLRQGCDVTLQHNPATYRVLAKWSSMYLRGSGAVQSPPGTVKCTITDRDIRNNSCQCAPPVPQ